MDGSELQIDSESKSVMTFQVGDHVQILRLEKSTHLNGMSGIIISGRDETSGRYGVSIIDTAHDGGKGGTPTAKQFALQPKNITNFVSEDGTTTITKKNPAETVPGSDGDGVGNSNNNSVISTTTAAAGLAIALQRMTLERDALLKENKTIPAMQAALHAVQTKAAEFDQKYFELVWTARRDIDEVLANPNHISYPHLVKCMHKWPAEIKKLKEVDGGDWHHGFNSGLLAASRLFGGLARHKEEECRTYDDYDDDDGEEQQQTPPTLLEKLKELRTFALNSFPHLDS